MYEKESEKKEYPRQIDIIEFGQSSQSANLRDIKKTTKPESTRY